MKDLPKRPRTHEIENLSDRYFKNFMPISWILTPIILDYGTDYNCEIVEEKCVTGMNFSIQLKGKETELDKEFIKIVLKRTSINRWLNRLEPTLIISYIVDENKAYWSWIKDDTFDLTSSQQNFTIKIPRKNELEKINWKNITEWVSQIFRKRHLLYSSPKINTHNETAWKLFFENKFEKALAAFNDLAIKNKKDSSLFEAMAIAEYKLFNYQKALVNINKAIEINSKNGFYFIKACILTEQGFSQSNFNKIKDALSIFFKLEKDKHISSELFYNIGSALSMLNFYKESIYYFKKALELNPNKPEIWNNLGNAYMNIREHSLEIECYDNALNINPNLSESLFSKGSSLFKNFNIVEKGLELMIKATEISNRHEIDNPYVFFWISEAFYKKRDFKNSKKWNQRGLDFFSDDDFLLKQRERIKTTFS